MTYVIAGANGLSKAAPIQLIEAGSYRVQPYLKMLKRVTYIIVAPVLEAIKAGLVENPWWFSVSKSFSWSQRRRSDGS